MPRRATRKIITDTAVGLGELVLAGGLAWATWELGTLTTEAIYEMGAAVGSPMPLQARPLLYVPTAGLAFGTAVSAAAGLMTVAGRGKTYDDMERDYATGARYPDS